MHWAIKVRTKYPIKDGHKMCSACGDHLPVTEEFFSRVSPNKLCRERGYDMGYRSQCKKCKSKIAHRSFMVKKLEAYPELYLECKNEECNYIWRRIKTLSCKKCGSWGE